MKLTVTDLAKQIQHHQILKEISFQWAAGEIVGLVGRNGAGKTTLMRCLTGQYRTDHGEIALDQQPFSTVPAGRQELIMVDPQQNFFKGYALKTVATFYAELYPHFDQKHFSELMAQQKLAPEKRFRDLSKGQQAYVAIALAITSGAKFILLDEPFDGLDLLVREDIIKLIIKANTDHQQGFLIASHNLTELDGLSDRVLFLKHEQLVADVSLETFRTQSKKLQLVFRQNQVPQLLSDQGQILSIHGRVIEVFFKDYTEEIDQALKTLDPVLMENLPLSLSDLFKVEYAYGKDDL
ncbi:ATP-binding cassette domain-containing protein [Lapidilactobacillus wuchangensis]|uniref:ATP-binding cassette domain-containing protein n=1 Tax=Lapidilactobacillus wuchangensis TaxID=2486001 RepID=UPI000F76F94A|nr:ABC transporter ATP-binding protein [Lapidilactobacillus wuchangensis]